MATARVIRSSSSTSSSTTPPPPHKDGVSGDKRPKVKPTRRGVTRRGARKLPEVEVFQALERLKRKMRDWAPCPDIMNDFLDRVTTLPGFTFELRRGPRWLADVVARSCEEVLDKPFGHATVFLVSVPEHELVHGSVTLGKYVGSVVYFEDIQLGVVALMPPKPSQTQMYLRLLIDPAFLRTRAAPN